MSEKDDEVRAEIARHAIKILHAWTNEEPEPGPMSRDHAAAIGALIAAAVEVRQVQAERDEITKSLNDRIEWLEEVLNSKLEWIDKLKKALNATNNFLAGFHALSSDVFEVKRRKIHRANIDILEEVKEQ